MEDLIKRSDAIEAIRNVVTPLIPTLYGAGVKAPLDCEMALKAIPSAENEIVSKLKSAIESEELCKSCPTAERISSENLLGAMALGFSYGINADRPQGEVDAIEIYEKAESQLERNEITVGEFEKIIEPLKHLSYGRPQGKWEIYVISPFDGEDCRCSECGETGCAPYWNYCPNCGARMKGADDE